MQFTNNPLFKSRFSQALSYFSNLIKLKFLKIVIKLGILLAAIWLISGTWFGNRIIPILKSSSGGMYGALYYAMLSIKGLAVASLFIILTKIIIAKPISKILFVLVAAGLVILFLERFVF